MDALARLQAVHTTLRLMREHALCSLGSDGAAESAGLASDRCMADFFIFLGQTAVNAEELQERCDTLVQTLPKVSNAFLQALVAENYTREASGTGFGDTRVSTTESLLGKIPPAPSPVAPHAFTFDVDKESTMTFTSEQAKLSTLDSPPPRAFEEKPLAINSAPMVGLRAMERASTTLEDFCRSYFMFHDLEVQNPQQLFKHLPILSFVEAFIYQLDEENEEQVRAQISGKHLSGRSSVEKSAVLGEPFRDLEQALADQGLLTERISSELRDGVKYWRLEYALCEAVARGAHIAAEDVITAVKLKSFDYRVLNLLLYSLTGREVSEAHFNFLAVSELLVEISDDLYDYEDDVMKSSFNVLRMLVKVYGPARAPEILANLISEHEMRYQQLLDGLEPGLAKQYQERCKEATREGGGGSKYQFGSWTIPPPIGDEEAFRMQINSTASPQK